MPSSDEGSRRLAAFLALIRSIEVPGKDNHDAYRTIYGGHTFMNMSTHPNKKYSAWHHKSDAAGAYQIRDETYNLAVKHGIVYNFDEASQDKIALWLIDRKGATPHIRSAEYDPAFMLLKGTWSSLPGGTQQAITRENAIKFINDTLASDP